MQIHFYFLSSPRMLYLWIPLLILLIFLYYKKTLPPVSKIYRNLLLSLRILSFLILLLLIFEPAINIIQTHFNPARIAVLVDTSGSMQIQEEDDIRLGKIKKIINSDVFLNWSKDYQTDYFQFSDHLIPTSFDDLQNSNADGQATDFEQTFSELVSHHLEYHLNAAILFSDGVHNRGRSPAYLTNEVDFPVYSFSVGSDQEKMDVSIVRVLHHEAMFAGEETPLEIFVRGSGCGGQKATVNIHQNGTTINQAEIFFPEQGMETSVTLFITPEDEGIFEYEVDIPQLPGETNILNNQRKVMMRVLKGKHKVMLIANAPHPDLAMLKRIFHDSEWIDLTIRTFKSSRSFYEGSLPDQKTLKEQDVFILFHLPSGQIDVNMWKNIISLIRDDNKPVLWMFGPSVDLSKPGSITEILPARLSGISSEILMTPELTSQGLESPLFKSQDDVKPVQQLWQGLPPVFYSLRAMALRPESRVLMTGRSIAEQQQVKPLIASRHIGREKCIAIFGHALYRWDLLAQGIGKSSQGIYTFFRNAIRWLALREDVKNVQIQLDKLLYESGEPVWTGVRVLNEQSEPVANARVELILYHNDSQRKIDVFNQGNGLYQAQLEVFDGGAYQLIAAAEDENHLLGTDTTVFHLQPFQQEMLRTKADPQSLQRLSEKTNGFSASVDSLESFLSQVHFPQQKNTFSQTIRLHHKYWMLIFLLSLLFTEWWLRKRKEML